MPDYVDFWSDPPGHFICYGGFSELEEVMRESILGRFLLHQLHIHSNFPKGKILMVMHFANLRNDNLYLITRAVDSETSFFCTPPPIELDK